MDDSTLVATAWQPGYVALARSGELARRAAAAYDRMRDCDLCARTCRVDRLAGLKGVACRTGARAVVSSYGPHHGEESCLSGWAGSGTIFFSWCNLRCDFCQNWEISRRGDGQEMTAERLAATMLALQRAGCHNINFVSPSHVVAQILEALVIAVPAGLRLPLVYNTGGYDSLEALALLDGVIDIYMPDMKYGDSDKARRYSHIRDYVAANRAAVAEMHRQVGDLVTDDAGVARRGLLVRHLVMPGGVADTEATARFLAEEISPDTYVNVMGQYRPCHKAWTHPEIGRRPFADEFAAAVDACHRHGLTRLDEGAFLVRLLR